MTTLKEFFKDDLTKWSTEIIERPDGLCMMKGAKYYLVVLMYDGKALTTYYTLGASFKRMPEKFEVISSMLTDAILQYCPFEDWCKEQGLDDDSLKAKKIYDACRKQGEDLAWFLGDKLDLAMKCTDLYE